MYIHKLKAGKTQQYCSGAAIAVNTNKALPSAPQVSEVIPQKLKMENCKVREVSPEMKHVKIEKKYIYF